MARERPLRPTPTNGSTRRNPHHMYKNIHPCRAADSLPVLPRLAVAVAVTAPGSTRHMRAVRQARTTRLLARTMRPATPRGGAGARRFSATSSRPPGPRLSGHVRARSHRRRTAAPAVSPRTRTAASLCECVLSSTHDTPHAQEWIARDSQDQLSINK